MDFDTFKQSHSSTFHRFVKFGIVVLIFIVLLIAGIYKIGFSAPASFPVNTSIIVEPGQSITSIAQELRAKGYVRSSLVLRSSIIVLGGERKVSAGFYEFHKSENAFTIARRIVQGEYGYVPVKVTIPEGTNVFKIAQTIHEKFPQISEAAFLAVAKSKEGYLFPNTYFFPPQAPVDMIISMMSSEFNREIKKYASEMTATSTHSLKDVITMASILEGEVQTKADRKIVADILWRRISIGMLLQVDSTFAYVNGKTSAQLTLSDLKIDSPYNTYVHKGLPPTPISNPGIESIDAALHSTPNDYLYFLSDKNGITHYARTHDEHVKLKNQYLK